MSCLAFQRYFFILLLTLFSQATLQAHPLAPVLLTLRGDGDAVLQVAWIFSLGTGAINPAEISLDSGGDCQLAREPVEITGLQRITRIETYQCINSMNAPRVLSVNGLESTGKTLALRVFNADGTVHTNLLTADSTKFEIRHQYSGLMDQSISYFLLGVEHIIGGLDHLVFIVALFLLYSGRLKQLVILVTAFTVAHSLTLGLTTLNIINLPSRPVEVLIALSVAVLAATIVSGESIQRERIGKFWLIVFMFGLLHGLGFAGALAEIGVPENMRVITLLAFNIGIETGQLSILFACAMVFGLLRNVTSDCQVLRPVCGMLIGILSGYWIIERMALYV